MDEYILMLFSISEMSQKSHGTTTSEDINQHRSGSKIEKVELSHGKISRTISRWSSHWQRQVEWWGRWMGWSRYKKSRFSRDLRRLTCRSTHKPPHVSCFSSRRKSISLTESYLHASSSSATRSNRLVYPRLWTDCSRRIHMLYWLRNKKFWFLNHFE
jgi:hypothetical protein